MSKTFLIVGIHTTSSRLPFKAIRTICGELLFNIALNKWRHYVEADGEIIWVPTDPADDLLAYTLERLGNKITRIDLTPDVGRKLVDIFGLSEDDILVGVRIDEPFQPLEHLQYYIEVLKETGRDAIIPAPTDMFPIRDWEWALGPLQEAAHRVDHMLPRAFGRPGYGLSSAGRQGDGQELMRLLLKSGWIVPLLIDKPEALKEPWPYQPLWIDEPGQFEKAKTILEITGINPFPTSAELRQLFRDRPALCLLANNAMRRTMKLYFEHEGIVEVLRKMVEREGVLSVENKTVPGAEQVRLLTVDKRRKPK